MALLFKTNIAIRHQVHCCTSGYSILLSRSVPTSAWSFSSIKSFSSGNRLDFSVSSSTPQRTAAKGGFYIGLLLLQPGYFLFQLLEPFFPWKTFSACHSGARAVFSSLAFPPLCRAALSPRASHDNRSSCRKITNVSPSLEYQRVYHLVHEIAVVAYYDYTALEVLQIFFNTWRVMISRSLVGSSSTVEVGITHQYRTQVQAAAFSPTQFIYT